MSKAMDFEPTELNERDKHIGRKVIGKVKVPVVDALQARKNVYNASKQFNKDKIKKLKREIKTHKLMIKRAKLDYKISKRGN